MKRLILTGLVVLIPGTAFAQNGDLEKAYLKEFAFLKAEKEQLKQRLDEVKRESEDRIAKAQREIRNLEGRVLGLRQQADLTDEQLREAERNSEQADKADLVWEVLTRARDPLDAAGLKVEALPTDRVPTVEETIEVLKQTFDQGAVLLDTFDDVTSETGRFFRVDGTQVEGDIIRVGNVSAYGISGDVAGALAPAGGGKFRIWPDPAAETARALKAGNPPDMLRMFLFESTEKAITAKAEKTISDELKAGGVIAYVIAGLGLLGLALVLFRTVNLVLIGASTRSLADKVVPMVESGNLDQATSTAKSGSGACARVLTATLRHIRTDREKLDDLVQEAMLNETPKIERFGTAILVIAAVAPLMGLLGTVTGMIATFDIITEFGTGDPRMLSGGISEALITTKYGLVVAIPTLLLGTLLLGLGESIISNIEHAALRVINASDGLSPNAPPAHGPTGSSGRAPTGTATEPMA